MTLAFLAFAWLLGIAAAAFTNADPAASLAAAGLLGAISFGLAPRIATLVLIAFGSLAVFGAAWRYEATDPAESANAIAHLNGEQVRFRAVVSAEPEARLTSRLYRVEVQNVLLPGGWQQRSGGVLVRTAVTTTLEYGDLVEVRGRLEDPPELEEFDYREYLAREGISSVVAYPEIRLLESGHGSALRSGLIEVRKSLTGAIDRSLPEPESSLAAGILLGGRGSLPRELKNDMDVSGTSHLVAVSGQNVTMLAGLVIAALAWLIGRRPACLIALLSIGAYAALVGAEASVVRAAIMGALYIAAIATGRQNSAWAALLLAAASMTAYEPRIVHEVSFQLSFAAVLGLATIAAPLQERMESHLSKLEPISSSPLTRPILSTFSMSMAAIAFTLPITAVNFHQVSLVAPVANLFLLPAFVAVAGTAAIVAVAGSVVPASADALAWLAWPPAAYMVGVVGLFGSLPAASVRLEGVGVVHAIAYYVALAAVVTSLLRNPRPAVEPASRALPRFRIEPVRGAICLLVFLSALIVWAALHQSNTQRLTVTFLEVGQGEAALIEGPSGSRVLVDGGPSGEAITGALGRHLRFYDDRIDLAVLTHPQADHVGGLPAVLERYQVSAVLQPPVEYESSASAAWSNALAHSKTPVLSPRRGQLIDLGGGATLSILSSGRRDTSATPNDSSLVLKLSFGTVSMLLTADIEEHGERRLTRDGIDLRADVLKVAHHGSETSSSEAFLNRVQPRMAVISVGEANRFGHPDATVLDRLGDIPVYRTDEDGDIVLSTDGRDIWVDVGR